MCGQCPSVVKMSESEAFLALKGGDGGEVEAGYCVRLIIVRSAFVGVCAGFATGRASLAAEHTGRFNPNIACAASTNCGVRQKAAAFPSIDCAFTSVVQ